MKNIFKIGQEVTTPNTKTRGTVTNVSADGVLVTVYWHEVKEESTVVQGILVPYVKIETKITKGEEEYRVRLFVDGEYQAGADYFTDGKEDAYSTALHMEANGGISDKTTDFAKSEQSDYDEEEGGK